MEKGESRIIAIRFKNDAEKVKWTGRKKIETFHYTAFLVFHKKWEEEGVFYQFEFIEKGQYELMKENGWKKMLKPSNKEIIFERDLEMLTSRKKQQIERSYILEDVSEYGGNPEDYGLLLPKDHPAGEITLKTEVAGCLPEVAGKIIRKKCSTCVIVGNGREVKSPNKSGKLALYETYCLGCGKKNTITESDYTGVKYFCQNCGYVDPVVDRKFRKKLAEDTDSNLTRCADISDVKTKRSAKFLYVCPKKDGIEIFRTNYAVSANDGVITEKITVDRRLVYEIGGEHGCYEVTEGGERPCSSVGTMYFSEKTAPDIVYSDAKAFDHFMLIHEDFLKKIGFLDILKSSNESFYQQENIFREYITLITEYPVIESLIKMGHVNLFLSMFKDVNNLNTIRAKIYELNALLAKDETKANKALRFPAYIGDYLIKKFASIEEYSVWADIYELTNISKEHFDELVGSALFCVINSTYVLNEICNILKYGYTFKKLLHYIVKTYSKALENKKNWGHNGNFSISICNIIGELKDYLQFCEELHVEPDMYPMDLEKQHDDMMKMRTRMRQEMYLAKDAEQKALMEKRKGKFKEISEKTEAVLKCPEKVGGLLPAGVPADYDKYVVIIPKSEEDFVNEGNMQHNCVGGYYTTVLKGDSQVFFLREKESPDKSYITGQCAKGKLVQFLYANNRFVGNYELKQIGMYIARQIQDGIDSGEIPMY